MSGSSPVGYFVYFVNGRLHALKTPKGVSPFAVRGVGFRVRNSAVVVMSNEQTR